MSEGCAHSWTGLDFLAQRWDEGCKTRSWRLGAAPKTPQRPAWHWPPLAFAQDGRMGLAKIGLCIRWFQIGRDLCAQYEIPQNLHRLPRLETWVRADQRSSTSCPSSPSIRSDLQGSRHDGPRPGRASRGCKAAQTCGCPFRPPSALEADAQTRSSDICGVVGPSYKSPTFLTGPYSVHVRGSHSGDNWRSE